MADWIETESGRSICFHDPVRTAYLIIMLMEKERVPRCHVDETLKAVKDILDFQEVIHTARDEKNPRFPK